MELVVVLRNPVLRALLVIGKTMFVIVATILVLLVQIMI